MKLSSRFQNCIETDDTTTLETFVRVPLELSTLFINDYDRSLRIIYQYEINTQNLHGFKYLN